jgi:hypothetical protein
MRRNLLNRIVLLLLCPVGICANATIVTVTNTNDSGPGSLRNALAIANDGDTISFAITGTIGLTSGELLVNSSITIVGPGADNLAVDGNTNSRVFHIASGRTVTISGLTITRGRTQLGSGGGIYNESATLIVDNCNISSNSAYNGGGIDNDGYVGSATAEINDSIISSNLAGSGGGILNDGQGGMAILRMRNTILNTNHSDYGGAIFNAHGTASVSSCMVTNNSVNGDGGGIFNGSAAMDIDNSTLSGNSAISIGGGIYTAGGSNGSANLSVTNSTLNQNSTINYAGAIYNDGTFGASTLDVSNSTFSGNSAPSGGGSVYNHNTAAAVGFADTILKAGSAGGTIFNDGGTITSHGYNLSSDDGGGYLTALGDQIDTDPLLGPLQNNGGPTATIALLPNSPAIDTGDPNAPLRDQRYYLRNDAPDKGAFEYNGALAPLSSASRKTHGAAGVFDIDLPLTGSAGVECRTGGANGNHQILINFASSVMANSASVINGVGGVSNATLSGSQLVVNLTGVANAQQIIMRLSGVNDGVNTTNVDIPMRVLLGDTNGNGMVNAADVSQTKAQADQSVTSSNFHTDVNANGVINATDASLVRSQLGTGVSDARNVAKARR